MKKIKIWGGLRYLPHSLEATVGNTYDAGVSSLLNNDRMLLEEKNGMSCLETAESLHALTHFQKIRQRR